MSKDYKVLPIWSRPPWMWFFSIRVGLVLLAILAAASILATLIEPLERALELVYYSWWYTVLLLLLVINIGCATTRTVIQKILTLRRPRFQRNPQFYQARPSSATIDYDGGVKTVADALHRKGFKVATNGVYGYAHKGMFSRLGAPISHIGIIIVLLGGFASGWVASEGVVRLLEGEQTDSVTLRTEPPRRVSLGFTLRCDDFDTGFFPKTRIPSKFISTVTILNSGHHLVTVPVEVNRSLRIRGWSLHQTSYEEISGQPRYRLTIAHPDLPTTIPLELSLGQQRTLPGLDGTEIALGKGFPLRWTIARAGQPAREGVLTNNRALLRVRAERFEPDFVMGPNRKISSRSQDMNNPALKIVVYDGERVIADRWLFARQDVKAMMHGDADPYIFDLLHITGQHPSWSFHITARETKGGEPVGDFVISLGEEALIGSLTTTQSSSTNDEPVVNDTKSGKWSVKMIEPVPTYATVLTMNRNPMIPFIYAGCAMTMIGLIIAFFIGRKEVWFWVDETRKRLYVTAIYRHQRLNLDPATNAALVSLTSQNQAKNGAN